MNDVSFIGKLLDGVEIEWKPLGEIIKLEKGHQLNKELLSENGLYPAFNGGVSYSG
ncbi:type I restriction endonuclease subunit R, partial [Methylococcaceae bacterium HT4]